MVQRLLKEASAHIAPVRVEEPAGKREYCEPGGPCEVECVDGCQDERVAQSANADVREELAVGLNSIIDTPYGKFTKGDYAAFIRDIAHSLLERVATLPVPAGDETWRLVERYVEHYPDDWRLVFKRGDEVREVSVPEEVWRVFDS